MTDPEGNNESCFPRDQSLRDLLYSKTKQKQILKNALRFQRQHQATGLWSRVTAVNISRVTVNCFPFDVIVFAMLPAHGIWRETVSLLDVMWPWTSQWMGALKREKRQLYNNCQCCIRPSHHALDGCQIDNPANSSAVNSLLDWSPS